MSKLAQNVSDFVNVFNVKEAKRIAVIGDIMLDIYDQVHVNRISPEFPIPVIDCQGDDTYVVRPGGAANVCEQFRNFNADIKLVSFLNDVAAVKFTEHKFDTSWSLFNAACHVPIKRRYYDGDYPLVRMDHEKKNYGFSKPELHRDILAKKFSQMAEGEQVNVAVFSDYNKGMFDPVAAQWLVSKCHDLGITTIVDPKKNPFQWQHCTIFKPNLAEAAAFLRVEQSWVVTNWKDACQQLKDQTLCESVVVTNGGKGVFGLDKGEPFFYQGEYPVSDVRSVIGAGDCFVAVLALAVAHGYPVGDAAQVAYEAGAVYVQKKHNEPVWPHELLGRVHPSYAKIVGREMLSGYLKGQQGKRVVFANGCFDILHRGHTDTLEFAKKQGDILVVGVNTDESTTRLKGPSRPVNNLCDRQAVLASLGCVDFVTKFEEDTPAELIAALKPHVVVKGGQYAKEQVVGHETCEVVLAPMAPGLSTTNIIEKMK